MCPYKFGLNELLKATKNVDKYGELNVLLTLAKKGRAVEWHGSREAYDILVDSSKRVEVKSCNRDNDWAKKGDLIGGWDRIDPTKFDYLVCVSFDKNMESHRYFIFHQEEKADFPLVNWKAGKAKGLRKLELGDNISSTENIIALSENKWDKIDKK